MTQRRPCGSSACEEVLIAGLPVQITRKRVRNINLRVRDDGTIALSAPPHTPLSYIETIVRERSDWIAAARQRVATQESRHAKTCENGAIVWVWGLPYRCQLEPAAGTRRTCTFEMAEGTLVCHVPEGRLGTDEQAAARRTSDLSAWLRAKLAERVEQLRPSCEQAVQVRCAGTRIRQMSSRWGSCNTATHKVTLNLNLVHHEPECLEYVLCHELCHLHEPSHNKRFHALMDQCYPNWRSVRNLLNSRC